MKIKFTISLIAVTLSIMLCSCLGVPGIPHSFSSPIAGIVVDNETGKAIAGVKVVYSPQSFNSTVEPPTLSCYTNANGCFLFERSEYIPIYSFAFPFGYVSFPETLRMYDNRYSMTVSAKGYAKMVAGAKQPYASMRMYEILTLPITTNHLTDKDGFIVIRLIPRPLSASSQ